MLDLDALVQFCFDGQLILSRVVPVSPVDGTRGLVADELGVIGQYYPVRLCAGLNRAVPVSGVVGLENLLRGLYEEVVVSP